MLHLLSRLPAAPLRLISFHLASATPSPRRCASTAVDKRKSYSHTLFLPKTPFPLRHKDILAVERKYRQRSTDELYRAQFRDNPGPVFVLHDGPPYANGNLHMGHALNRILKDIINRWNVLRGRKVHYVPGWDCHGLPIELKALAELNTAHTKLDPVTVRRAARQTAVDAIAVQKEEMRELGVMADWEGGVYATMEHGYEIRQLKLFQKMVEKGYISHRLRPIYYSPSTRTALAEAELVYKDHKSRSVYVTLPVAREDMSDALKHAYTGNLPLSLTIWTTTPWSLPGNLGVAVHGDLAYCLVSRRDQVLIIAEDRLEAMKGILGALPVIGRLTGRDLAGTRYTHRFHPPKSPLPRPIVFIADHVTSQSGTGLVHSAPAHGYEDYEAFVTAGILPKQLRCPVDDDGRFTESLVELGVGNEPLVGLPVLTSGTEAIIELLRQDGTLLAEEEIEHRYPCDWKTKQPIIIRATPQWFADVESVKAAALDSLDDVNFVPAQSRNRLEAFVSSRSEWCISRQRSWGVPIPALFDESGQPVLTTHSLSHIIKVLDEKGTDYWWTGPVEDFIPPSLVGRTYTKGSDTLDVWFDSGSSWTLLDETTPNGPLADVYLEGSDQHRGWFQSSLLTRLSVSPGFAPYRNLITHGFTMDEQGQKMSKSEGNGVSPMDIIRGTTSPAYGADALRLWAASVDYTRDVSFGPSALSNAVESLRKLRSACRFLLGNTTAERLDVNWVTLSLVDRYVLHQLASIESTVEEAYETFALNKALQTITSFASSTLSAFYYDVVKDILYCDPANSPERQAVIATLQHVSHSIFRMIAPITPHLSEELYEHSGRRIKRSVFLDHWEKRAPRDEQAQHDMSLVLPLRMRVSALIEHVRGTKRMKSAGEARLWIWGEANTIAALQAQDAMLPSLFLGVSEVQLNQPIDPNKVWGQDLGTVTVAIGPSRLHECPRCWRFASERSDGGLCPRCASVLGVKD